MAVLVNIVQGKVAFVDMVVSLNRGTPTITPNIVQGPLILGNHVNTGKGFTPMSPLSARQGSLPVLCRV